MTMTELFARYDVAVPRYTSYPPVPHWRETPPEDTWLQSIRDALAGDSSSLALYVHVPFCQSLCTFCGCNNVITRNHDHETPMCTCRTGRVASSGTAARWRSSSDNTRFTYGVS